MGLLYPLPISRDETDFVKVSSDNKKITLKSYGLPYIFWLYGFASFLVFGFMMLGIKSTLLTLLNSEDQINRALAIAFICFVVALTLGAFAFFFYQKVIEHDIQKKFFKVKHIVAGITLKVRSISTIDGINFNVSHFLDSPNYARLHGQESMRGFKNKGYFTLEASNDNNSIFIDRSSNKADLEKIKVLLEIVNKLS